MPIHGFGEIEGRLYLDMRLIRGPSMEELLRSEGPLTAPRAVSIVGQVASALESAHQAGLLHRDVKPSNVMVLPAQSGRAEFAYLTDFGIARAMEATTRSALTAEGSAIGTLDYMAPELFLGKPIDHRVDIYALGCLLHQGLTAQRPFPGEGLAALMYAHLNRSPPRPSDYRPDVPAGLDDVIARALAKNPEDRYQTAGELAAAAQEALNTTGTTSAADPRAHAQTVRAANSPTKPAAATMAATTPVPAAPTSPARTSSDQRPRLGPLVAVGFLVAAMTVVGVFWLATPHNPRESDTPRQAPSSSAAGDGAGANPASAAPGSPGKAAVFQVGQEATNGSAAVTVKTVTAASEIELNESNYRPGSGFKSYTRTPAGAGAKYVIVATRVRNNAKKSMDLTCSLPIKTLLVDDKGRNLDAIQDLYKVKGNPECNNNLQPGFESDMAWIYRVPSGAHITGWAFQDLTEPASYGTKNTTLVSIEIPGS